MDKFANKMDGNILYYVAALLDPRIKTSVIRALMKEEDAQNVRPLIWVEFRVLTDSVGC